MQNKYLEILGLEPGASPQEVKAAYRKLSKIHHPDISRDEHAKEKFIEINEAYNFLTKVGPHPNSEPIRYDYDPFIDEYERWRNMAKEWAKRKAWEEERLQNELIKKVLGIFNYLSTLIILFNAMLAADYFLPRQRHAENVQKVVMADNEVYFDNYKMRLKRADAAKLKGQKKAVVMSTIIFNKPMSAIISNNGLDVKFNQSYNIFYGFGYIIAGVFLMTFLYHYAMRTLDGKLTSALVLCVFFIIQIFLFFLY